MKTLKITRKSELEFDVQSSGNTYAVSRSSGKWTCNCPARGICKHLRTAIGCFGMAIGQSIDIEANTDSTNDGMLDPSEFDAEAGRDVRAEIKYIKSGREKRNYGC